MNWNDSTQPPLIMGILNVTPDSFSDGGAYEGTTKALKHARSMLQEGADIIDVGGESTRPGSERQSAARQKARVIPIIRALRDELGSHVPISIDTTLSDVAEAALESGATIINDISAGREADDMFQLASERCSPLVLMHMKGEPKSMQRKPGYQDVLNEVSGFLRERRDAALDAGVAREKLLLDPGIGFGKRREDNLALIRSLDRFQDLGCPLLLGTSRKRFMGSLCDESEPRQLLGATCATTTLGVSAGVRVFRVHDVKANRQAATIAWHLLAAR